VCDGFIVCQKAGRYQRCFPASGYKYDWNMWVCCWDLKLLVNA